MKTYLEPNPDQTDLLGKMMHGSNSMLISECGKFSVTPYHNTSMSYIRNYLDNTNYINIDNACQLQLFFIDKNHPLLNSKTFLYDNIVQCSVVQCTRIAHIQPHSSEAQNFHRKTNSKITMCRRSRSRTGWSKRNVFVARPV